MLFKVLYVKQKYTDGWIIDLTRERIVREAGRFFKYAMCEYKKMWEEIKQIIKQIISEFPLIKWNRNYQEGLELFDCPPPITPNGEPEAYK